MIRNCKLIFLSGVLCLLAISSSGQAVQKDTARISLDEVAIFGLRIPENQRQLSRMTRVITRHEIEASPAHDLADFLEYIPDIDVRHRGPLGVQADISLRGGTFDQFAVLINGICFNDPQTGHFQMDIPIPLSMIKQIELLPGSDVKSLGANAFTGAINIVTGIPERKSLHAGLAGGQHGFLEAGIDGRNVSGYWWQQSGVVLQKSNGYRENTDFNNLNGFFQAGYSRNRLNLSLMAGGLKKAFGANSFYTAKYPDQFERTGTGFTAIQSSFTGRVNVSESIYYRFHNDVFSLFRSNPPEWYKSPNYHHTQTVGSKTDVWFNSVLGKSAIGFEYRQESIWSTVLGEPAVKANPLFGTAGIDYDHFGSRSHFSLSAEHQVITGPVKWNGGVVLHQVIAAKNYFQIYPGLDISVSPGRSTRAFVSLNRAFRLPTFTELYYKSPTNQGNPGLLPETALHAETGAEYQKSGLTLKLLGFYRYASQSIDWVRAQGETIWHTENLGRIMTTGLESGMSYVPGINNGFLKIVDRLDLGYRRYFQHHAVESLYSQYVLDYLKWKMTAGAVLKIGRPFRISINWVWQERNGTYTVFGADQKMTEVDYKPFMLVDLKLSFQFRQVRLIAECTNLFNKEYFDLGSVPQPGAWYKAGIEVNLQERN